MMMPMPGTDDDALHALVARELPVPVYIVENETVRWVNRAFVETFGWSLEQLVDHPFTEFIDPDELPKVAARYRRRMAGEQLSPELDYAIRVPDERGSVPVRGMSTAVVIDGRELNIGTLRDISERRATEAALARNVATVAEQREALMRLTAPTIEVEAGVVVMPLIGIYDEARSAALIEDVVTSLARRRATRLLLDLGGLTLRGPAVLSALVRIVRSARLIGVRCALIGISPELAATFVELEVDISGFDVHATLADALR